MKKLSFSLLFFSAIAWLGIGRMMGADGILANAGGTTVFAGGAAPFGTVLTNGHSLPATISNLFTVRSNLLATTIVSTDTITATNGYVFPATQVILTNIVYTNVTLDFPSTASLAFSDIAISVQNLKSNDITSINPPAAAQTNGIFNSWISNTTLYARYHNYRSTAINPASGIFNVTVQQFK